MSFQLNYNGLHNGSETVINSNGFLVSATNGTPVVGDGGFGSVRYRVARAAYFNSDNYIHIKTVLRMTSNGTHPGVAEMYRVNLTGFSYGASKGIDSVCVGYVYNTGGYLGAQNIHTRSGCCAVTQYLSSDGYLTFTIAGYTYYTTFSLAWEKAGGNGQLRDADSIISITTSNSATI
jgi:hypothetical protein